MRHIPEDELHAYLDQALSRSQCVEIESHLAACPSCQALRDGIAALRDRTTALLTQLAPPRSISPSYESLRRRADVVISARRRRIRAVAWAASLVLAVGLGYGASAVHRPHAPAAAVAERAPSPIATPSPTPAPTLARVVTPSDSVATARVRSYTPVRHESPARSPNLPRASVRLADAAPRAADSARAHRESVLAVLNPVPAVELSKLDSPSARGEEFSGMWRTLSWDGAQAEAGKPLPHVDGLPVMQVQVQKAEGARPLMVVAQQLSSGTVIRTIEGSASDVSQLLARRQAGDVDSAQLLGDTVRGGNAINPDHAMAMQLGDRMLAITGNLPSDSLRAMIRRMNAEMRSK